MQSMLNMCSVDLFGLREDNEGRIGRKRERERQEEESSRTTQEIKRKEAKERQEGHKTFD